MFIKKSVPKNPTSLKELIAEYLKKLEEKFKEDRTEEIEIHNYLMFR